MVERRKVNGITLITPTILGLVILAAVLAGGAAVNYYLAVKETRMINAYIGYANELTNAFAGNREEQQSSASGSGRHIRRTGGKQEQL